MVFDKIKLSQRRWRAPLRNRFYYYHIIIINVYVIIIWYWQKIKPIAAARVNIKRICFSIYHRNYAYIVHNQCGNCHVICRLVWMNARGEHKDRIKMSSVSCLEVQAQSNICDLDFCLAFPMVTNNKRRILIHRIGVKRFLTSTFCASRIPPARQIWCLNGTRWFHLFCDTSLQWILFANICDTFWVIHLADNGIFAVLLIGVSAVKQKRPNNGVFVDVWCVICSKTAHVWAF